MQINVAVRGSEGGGIMWEGERARGESDINSQLFPRLMMNGTSQPLNVFYASGTGTNNKKTRFGFVGKFHR